MLVAKCLLLDGVPLSACNARAMPPVFLHQSGQRIALGNFVHDNHYGVAAACDSLSAQVPAFRNVHLSEEHGASLLAEADVPMQLKLPPTAYTILRGCLCCCFHIRYSQVVFVIPASQQPCALPY